MTANGTTAGTKRVRDIVPGLEGSASNLLTAVGGTLSFVVYTAAHGGELWKRDGSRAGTVLIEDPDP